jgi:F420-dependent oxidoreductase-like protein
MLSVMRISVNLTNFSWSDGIDSLGPVVRAADRAGLDTVWVSDHLVQAAPFSSLDEPMLEAYTTLGYLAASTESVRLGTMVTAATYRAPALLVKAVTTLDVLSGGRAWLGIGSGYHEEEARMMGLPLPATAERFEHLEETLRLALRMWAGDESPFNGKHHTLARPLNHPNSITRPHPPILIGGMGEKKTLRLVAQYGDACNLPDIPDGGVTIRRKLDVLRRHCDDVGRDYDDIEKTVSSRFDPDTFDDRCAELSAMGIDHVVLITNGPWTVEAIDALSCAGAHSSS